MVLLVGSRPAGVGRYSQLDLMGSMWEWTLDWFGGYQANCNNCANLTSSAGRVYRGGAFASSYAALTTAGRNNGDPTMHIVSNGFRCARTP